MRSNGRRRFALRPDGQTKADKHHVGHWSTTNVGRTRSPGYTTVRLKRRASSYRYDVWAPRSVCGDGTTARSVTRAHVNNAYARRVVGLIGGRRGGDRTASGALMLANAYSLACHYCILHRIVFHIIKRVKTTAIISLAPPVAERGFYRFIRAPARGRRGLKLYIISLYAILIIKLNHLRGERPVIKTVRGPFVPVYLQITRYLGVHVFAINQPPGFCKGR